MQRSNRINLDNVVSFGEKILRSCKGSIFTQIILPLVSSAYIVMLALLPATSVGASGAYTISGIVVDPSGTAISNVSVEADSPGTNSLEFGPVLTSSDGSYSLPADIGFYDIHFNPPSSSGLSPLNDSYVKVSGNQTLNMHLNASVSGYHIFSGSVTDQNGNLIDNELPGICGNCGSSEQDIDLFSDVSGDTNQGAGRIIGGQFSLSTPADNYDQIDLNFPGYFFSNQQSPVTFNLTNSDLIQNFHITMVGLSVTVEDSDGNNLSGASVKVQIPAESNTVPAFIDGSLSNGIVQPQTPQYIGTTNTNGSLSFLVPEGVVIPGTQPGPFGSPYGACATVSNNKVCMGTDYTVSQNNNIILKQDSIPSAPTNLSAISPTNSPTLSWVASNSAVWYNIYRNGTNVGVTNSIVTSFNDLSATEGTYTYNVTAQNSGGESQASNTITVIVDKTPPTTSNVTIKPKTVKSGSLVTIMANASDAFSGVAGGEFYIDNDPGVGNGTPMTYSNGIISIQATLTGLTKGKHVLYVRSEDRAGNYSSASGGITFNFNP